MFDKILIANRGEIAVRVARTCRRLGIRTVAVYSDADAGAMHVAACDEAHRIGPAPARESYLNAARIVEVAQTSGAQAVHPGYGFLSENAGFAEACAKAGLVFIGPPAEAIRAMGSKSAAKRLMEEAGVPLVPGYHGENQDSALLRQEAERIGYPVLIKASAGGGGKGMKVVETRDQFDVALASAQREAAAAFGDARVLIEKYLTRPRHIEMQIFADAHGNAVHLFERDCSVQRRHQKVLEEAPAPGMTAARRRQMGSAAVAAARAVGYANAGTVEFIADERGEFYFMEMNTRLQVEHPVTEMITGLDLVEWQLRVAAGESLPLAQEQLSINGHAIEARVYAEEPARDFLPAAGTIRRLRQPQASAHVRVDTGVREGDDIGVHYDPMIAKLIVWDIDRTAALRRMRGALADYQIVGPGTNVQFLLALVSHRAFALAHREPGLLDTGLIGRYHSELLPETKPATDVILALAVLSELSRIDAQACAEALASGDPWSPWHARDGWRMNEDNHHVFAFDDGDRVVEVTAHYRRGGFLLDLPGGSTQARAQAETDGRLVLDLGGRRIHGTVVRQGDQLTVFADGVSHRLALRVFDAIEDEQAGGTLAAPMPGNVVQVLVQAGAQVEKGQPLMIIEAMKMEHTICAPAAGTVKEVLFVPGDQVRDGEQLFQFERES
ncbi:MAG: acetyl/propionyl/methylcrotonyl-CoA carboxylase subunit alpha [Burkholderiales bacterium]|nr:acetyl/propionyl/methylcrotonyl-CoA carboxylase subunit alpha [Burkholderiales bacterium]